MKNKVFLGAAMISSVFAACNNEEIVDVQNQDTTSGEVVGAQLVSNGLKINLSSGNVSSRVNENGWEITDKVGLAWYNVAGAITDEQTEKDWESVLSGNGATGRINIYANHNFRVVDNNGDGSKSFVTESNVYQGAHFVYFPYSYQSQVAQLKIDVNPAQESDFTTEFYNKALWVSAQDFITPEDVVDGTLEKPFYMVPVVNAIKATFTSNFDDEFINSLRLGDFTLTNSTEVFNTTAKIVPYEIPAVVLDEEDAIDVEKTKEVLLKNINDFTDNTTFSKTLKTEVKYDLTIGDEKKQIRMFTLPTQMDNVANTSATLNVYKGTHRLGSFRFNKNSSEEAITKLNKSLGTPEDGVANLTKINYNKDGVWSAVNLPFTLSIDNFTLNQNVASVEEWKNVVAMIDALYESGCKTTEYTITLTKDITFNEGDYVYPKNCDLKVKSSKQVTITVNDNVEDWKVNAELNDNLGTTVTVVANNKLGVNFVSSTIWFETGETGKIYAGKDADIWVRNNNGEVVIDQYGAKTNWNANQASGIVSFKYDSNTNLSVKQINNLVIGDSKGSAYVNTIYVDGVEFALDRKDVISGTTTEDPYEGESSTGNTEVSYTKMNNVTFVLENGATLTKGDVKAIVSNSGVNKVIDVTSSEIKVNAGELTLATENTDKEEVFALDNLTVKAGATFTADSNVKVMVTNLDSKGTIKGNVVKAN